MRWVRKYPPTGLCSKPSRRRDTVGIRITRQCSWLTAAPRTACPDKRSAVLCPFPLFNTWRFFNTYGCSGAPAVEMTALRQGGLAYLHTAVCRFMEPRLQQGEYRRLENLLLGQGHDHPMGRPFSEPRLDWPCSFRCDSRHLPSLERR